MATTFPPTWQRSFAQPAVSSPTLAPPVRRFYGGYTAGSPVDAGEDAPPNRPTPPVDRRPLPPEPPRRPLELRWLTWQLPAWMREAVILNLRQTLDWRAQYCQPLDAPKTPHAYTRFGLVGEQLVPKGAQTVRNTLYAELRQMIRVVEGRQSRTERNYLLAMHSVRLGQLCAELEQRGLDTLELLRNRLGRLWD